MFEDVLVGNFIYIDYYPYDKDTKSLGEPIRDMRVRMQDYGNADIAEGISRQFQEQDVNGRYVRKYDAKIQLLTRVPFVPQTGDKVYAKDYDITYFVNDVGYGWDSIKMLSNLNFRGKKKPPYVLYLGERT